MKETDAFFVFYTSGDESWCQSVSQSLEKCLGLSLSFENILAEEGRLLSMETSLRPSFFVLDEKTARHKTLRNDFLKKVKDSDSLGICFVASETNFSNDELFESFEAGLAGVFIFTEQEGFSKAEALRDLLSSKVESPLL